ncbi:putative protein isoform X3 [Capsicum annuum]
MESSTSPQLWWLVTQPCQNIGGLRRYFSSLYSLDFLIESEFGKRVPLLFLVTTCLFLFNLGQAKIDALLDPCDFLGSCTVMEWPMDVRKTAMES